MVQRFQVAREEEHLRTLRRDGPVRVALRVQALLKRRGFQKRLAHRGSLGLGFIQGLKQRFVFQNVPRRRGERAEQRLFQTRELRFQILLDAEQVGFLRLQRGLFVLNYQP